MGLSVGPANHLFVSSRASSWQESGPPIFVYFVVHPSAPFLRLLRLRCQKSDRSIAALSCIGAIRGHLLPPSLLRHPRHPFHPRFFPLSALGTSVDSVSFC
jgi:hypothetical protein